MPIRQTRKTRRKKRIIHRGGTYTRSELRKFLNPLVSTERVAIQYSVKRGGQPTKGVVVFTLSNVGGFFSTLGSLLSTYIYSLGKQYEFYIDHSDWQYTYQKGWHDYFSSLSTFNRESQYAAVEHYKHLEYPRNSSHTLKRYVDAILEIFKPVQRIQDSAESFIKTIGGDYTSIQIRRGDKSTEMEIFPIEKIIENCSLRDDGRRIFIMTDDYTVVEELQVKLPSCTIYTMCPKSSRGAHHGDILKMSPEQRKAHMDELIGSCVVFKGGKEKWSDVRSNVGRFLYLYSYPNSKLYPTHETANPDNSLNIVNKLK